MAQECVYTSAKRGLKPRSSGFCTVAHTKGMSSSALKVLEALSAYRTLFPGHDPRAMLNPIAFSHYRHVVDGENVSILSRIGPAGKDHTDRDNKLAHHILLNAREKPAGGPAWTAEHEDLWYDQWEKEAQVIEPPRTIPQGDVDDTYGSYWEQVTGDPGWAGSIAYSCVARPRDCVYIVYEPGTNILQLVSEVFANIPAAKRWHVTFNTYFYSLPPRMTCNLRCCTPDSPALKGKRGKANIQMVDLTRDLGAPRENEYVRIARGDAS